MKKNSKKDRVTELELKSKNLNDEIEMIKRTSQHLKQLKTLSDSDEIQKKKRKKKIEVIQKSSPKDQK